ASLELSARAATLLDTLSPHEYPDVEGSRAFFEDQGEIQAVARIVESQGGGLLAHWVIAPSTDDGLHTGAE
ncbi:MAG: hypothetical protein GY930_12085, partial [bacterium]|nr:hypothetical protein [bacterium]